MSLTRRVELLFDPEQFRRLEEIARNRSESVGSLIRKAVEREYLEPILEEKRRAVHELLRLEIPVGPWEEVKEDLGQAIVRRFETP